MQRTNRRWIFPPNLHGEKIKRYSYIKKDAVTGVELNAIEFVNIFSKYVICKLIEIKIILVVKKNE